MNIFFVIVNATSKLPEQYPDVSGFGQVLYFTSQSLFPVTGSQTVLNYVDVSTAIFYKWNGTAYIVDSTPRLFEWINDMNNGGMGSNQELVASWEPSAFPQVEDRYIQVDTVNEYNVEAHPVYSMLKQWRITYPQTQRDVTDKKLAVDDAEMEANETVIPHQQRLKMTILAFDSYLDLVGLTNAAAIDLTSLNAKKKKQLKIFKRAANKIRQNDTERDVKKDALTANPLSNPDLEANWSLDDFTEDV